jgi:hypothetical protein
MTNVVCAFVDIQALTEEEIFHALDLPYWPPSERDGIPIELYQYT